MSEPTLRDMISGAIVGAFERTYQQHGVSYDPDTCYEAADDVIAALMTALSGQVVLAIHPPVIGPATFRVYAASGSAGSDTP